MEQVIYGVLGISLGLNIVLALHLKQRDSQYAELLATLKSMRG